MEAHSSLPSHHSGINVFFPARFKVDRCYELRLFILPVPSDNAVRRSITCKTAYYRRIRQSSLSKHDPPVARDIVTAQTGTWKGSDLAFAAETAVPAKDHSGPFSTVRQDCGLVDVRSCPETRTRTGPRVLLSATLP
jgi:hypothetical protein